MKTLKASVVLFALLLCMNLSAQNLLGYKYKDIRQYMRENMKEMSFQGLTFNNTFKYLKYADSDGNQTILFFLTADSVCKSIRLISDKSLKADKIKELDTKYKKTGTNLWTDTKDGKNYVIELRDEEFTINVTIRIKD